MSLKMFLHEYCLEQDYGIKNERNMGLNEMLLNANYTIN